MKSQPNPIKIHKLKSGLILILEQMPHLRSVAYDLLIPGGIVNDPAQNIGASHILAELTSRGVVGLSGRELSESFDQLGIRHSESASQTRFSYRGALLAEQVESALRLVAKMVREPTFPEEQIQNIRSSLMQEIDSLKDNPARWAFSELSQRYYPGPYARASLGEKSGIEATDRGVVEALWKATFHPKGSILSLAGNLEFDTTIALVEELFEGWGGEGIELPPFGELPQPERYHLHHDSAQQQIVLCYPSAKFLEELYYEAKVSNALLAGGMFGRLFLEVREKRGLCYSVYSKHSANRFYGTVFGYAGTTPERAHETLSVMGEVFSGLADNIEEAELARAKRNLLASMVMAEESSGARAVSNATDWWLAGRIRTLEEIESAINKVNIDGIASYVKQFPHSRYTLLTVGPRDITV